MIFEELKIGNNKVKNRIVRSATWEAAADINGNINQDVYDIYDEISKGGTGMIITGFTSVDKNDHYFEGMMRLSDDTLIPEYRKLSEIIKKENATAVVQLALGRYFRGNQLIEPDEISVDEIQKIIKMFTDAAKRAKDAGFDGVQIHAAHFFFLSRFISPAMNHRTDTYGGNIQNRCRLLLEIMEGIRKAVPDLMILVKINANDYTRGGMTEEDCLKICKLLDQKGIDGIEISGNGTSVSGIRAHVNEGYFVPAAAMIAENVSCPVICVGGFRSADTMKAVLEKTKIQMISLSRPLLCESDFPKKIKEYIE